MVVFCPIRRCSTTDQVVRAAWTRPAAPALLGRLWQPALIVTVPSDWLGLLAQQTQPPVDRLDPLTRAKLLVVLVGLTLLGILLVLLTWMAGRAARRYVNRDPWPRARRPLSDDDWAKKPQNPD